MSRGGPSDRPNPTSESKVGSTQITGQAAKVTKVVMNPVSKMDPIERPSILNLQ